jgi:hypothetical protein
LIAENIKVKLPKYIYKASEAQKINNSKFVAWQSNMIVEQSAMGTRVEHIVVRCMCNTKIPVLESYKCLYCNIRFCVKCGQKHFGYRK